ncbi:MAG: nitrogenase component 1 [Methanophagales archaeon]|nr:nitrogenase component 1 [Methanophagales archaeon]
MTVSLPSQGSMFLGAYRMASSLKDCVVLVHGPSGCHFGPNFFEVLTNNLSSNATISAMRERSVVYGGIENLEKAISLTRKHYKDKQIIVLSSHVPSIIGDDLEFVDADIYLDCGGFQPMWQGMEAFLERLGDFICENEYKASESTTANLINLIGFQRDVACAEEDLAELKMILSFFNVEVNVIPDSLKKLKYARYASLNIVFGYGVKLARRMEREIGIPYIVVDYPYGVEGLKRFIEKISENCEFEHDINDKIFSEIREKLKRYRNNLPLFYDVLVCVVGDLPKISGMSKFLECELGMNVELAFATSSAMKEFDFDVTCTKFVSSYSKFIEELKGMDIKVLLGTDEERRILNNTIVFAFPSFTRMSYVPYLGKGTLNLIADIYERLMEWI